MDDTLKVNCKSLNEIFTFWYHNPDNVDWSLESYIELLEFSTIEEFWVLDKFVRKDMIENGMFFIMRNRCFEQFSAKVIINSYYHLIGLKYDNKCIDKSRQVAI